MIDKPESIEAYLGRLNILADEKTIETFTHMNAGAIENGTIASGSHISTFVPSWTAFSPPDVSGSKFPVDLGLLAQQSVQPQVLKAASLNREAINLAAGDFQQFGDFMRHREASSGIELAGQLIQTAAPKMNSSELALADFYLSVANDTNLKVLQSARAGTIPSSLIDTLEAYFKSTEMMGRRLQMGLPALDSRLVEVAVSPKASVAPDRSLRFRVYALPRGIFANDRISDEQRINLLFELSFQKLATFEEPTSRLLPTEVPMMIWIGPDFHHGEMAHLIANRLLKKVSAVSGQLASNEKQHIRLVWPDDLVEP
ncbi:MAG TPA: hypothetical protein VNQ97_07930 [Burkholderiaceae bacterium]|nr:hypothetical protein [Burkholderiaceae bacterium]